MKKRYGRFEISIDLIEKFPDLVKQIQEHTIIYRAEQLYCKRAIEYQAESELFDEIDIGSELPLYKFFLDEKDNIVKAEKSL